jgi:hypothetical protein
VKGDKLMRVTIVLETGGVFPREQDPQNHLDVGYFKTPNPSDIEVSEDGKPAPGAKLAHGVINVEHLDRNGAVKQPVKRSDWFELDLLRKDDLYPKAERPDFIAAAYDCILHFNSGDFNSADVQVRRFIQHLVQGDTATGKDQWTKAIANEIHVEYDIADGEVLRLRGPGGDVWSSASVGSGTKRVIVTIKTHKSLHRDYHKKALDHKGSHYYLPNSDPPPMNGNNGG